MNHLPHDLTPSARDLAVDYHDRHGVYPADCTREAVCPECGCGFEDCYCDTEPIHGQSLADHLED